MLLPGGHSHNVLVKNVASVFPFLESIPEAKLNRFRLVALRKEVLKKKKPRIDFVIWLTLMKECFDQT